MSLLAQIERGLTPAPPRITVYGVEGVGKSTFASEAPRPVFVQTEDGLSQIACDKFPLAATYDALGEYDSARPLAERALSLREQGLGFDHG